MTVSLRKQKEGNQESDIDIALFVAEKLNREEDRAVVRCFSDLYMEYDMVFSPMDIELGSLRSGKIFYRIIKISAKRALYAAAITRITPAPALMALPRRDTSRRSKTG